MECPRVCVIDNSPAIRETIEIVLGEGYRVTSLEPDEYLRSPATTSGADLLIVGDDALPPESASRLPGGPPVLWLRSHTPRPHTTAGPSEIIAPGFTPAELRSRVQLLLSGRPHIQPILGPWSIIEYPVLPKEVTELARRAAVTQFPVLICGEPGTGRARLARAIHALGSQGRFVTLSGAGCSAAAMHQAAGVAPGDLTVFVSDVMDLTTEGQQLLIELLDCGGFRSAQGWHRVRLICASTRSFEALSQLPALDRELYYRLSVFPITLPPLRERAEDIAALVHHIGMHLSRVLSTEPVTFTDRSMQRLTHYLWFGNLAELETVVTRTVALTQDRTIDTDDLLFGYGRIMPHKRAGQRRPVPTATNAGSNQTVDLIINELAHEFKNPMVTIKTVAQHLERLLADPTDREQVARLTGEAVDRMDRALENLLQFTRFRAPAPQDVSLSALLAPCLTELAPKLSERRVVLNYRSPEEVAVFVDTAQIVYALENLLRTMVRDLEEEQTLVVRPTGTSPGITFECTGSTHATGGKLAALLDHGQNGEQHALPLGVVFAKALIERNGGRVEIQSPAAITSVTVWLPSREAIAPANGKTTSIDS